MYCNLQDEEELHITPFIFMSYVCLVTAFDSSVVTQMAGKVYNTRSGGRKSEKKRREHNFNAGIFLCMQCRLLFGLQFCGNNFPYL
jgi:hypothetical protein